MKTIYDVLEETDQRNGEVGSTYLVIPALQSVTYVPDVNLTDHDASVYIDGDEGDGNTPDWPEGLAYRHRLEGLEVFDAQFWSRHLKELVRAGLPFYVQTVQIDYVEGEGDDTTVIDAVDIGLVAKLAN